MHCVFSALTLLDGHCEQHVAHKMSGIVVGIIICLQRRADCWHMVQLMTLPSQPPMSLASFKSRLVLPFWYRLTEVVLGKCY